MKLLLSKSLNLALASCVLALCVSCESDEPKRRKAVGPSTDSSGIPWNRPTSWEGAGRFGSMMPQSR